MKHLAPAALLAAAIVIAASLAGAQAQSSGAGAAYAAYAVDTFAYLQDYSVGKEIDMVQAGTVCGEPFTPGRPGRQLIGLAKLMEQRAAQGYTLVAYEEGVKYDWPVDGHYSNEEWPANVRLIWGKKG